MRKLKLGFTLAEVATAMTIVGVIAVIVVPLVTKNIQKNQSGAILGRAVEQIVLGNQNIIQLANARTLNGGGADSLSVVTKANLGIEDSNVSILPSLKDIVPAYWGLSSEATSGGDSLAIKSYSGEKDGTDDTNVNSGTKHVFSKFSAGISICGAGTVQSALDAETGYTIYIDTNGWDKLPNRAGIDVFAFKLLNNGTLIPATGTDAGNYAERVVKDGFKIKY